MPPSPHFPHVPHPTHWLFDGGFVYVRVCMCVWVNIVRKVNLNKYEFHYKRLSREEDDK